MQEAFAIIKEFPDYEISNFGRVIKNNGREMVLSPTQHGELTVGLVEDGVQSRRSVKVLVARYFVPGETIIFDTPILLDGDRNNLVYTNIRWRPRWFALQYVRQFENYESWQLQGPIMDVTHRIEYQNIMEAAMITGSLCVDIRRSIIEGHRVFPGGETYASSFI